MGYKQKKGSIDKSATLLISFWSNCDWIISDKVHLYLTEKTLLSHFLELVYEFFASISSSKHFFS